MRDRDELPVDDPERGPAPTFDEIAEKNAEKNIARLLRAADRAESPSEIALARWRERMHAELPAVIRRSHRRARLASGAPLAAAALLAIGLTAAFAFLRGDGGSFPLAPSGNAVELRNAGVPEWRPIAGVRLLGEGDAVRLSAGGPADSLAVGLGGGGEFTLERGTVRREDGRLLLAEGEGEWSAPGRRRGSLATPLLVLRATDAVVRIRVRETGPIFREGIDMNAPRKLAAAGGALAVIVTVIVLSTGDDPVELVGEGETVALEAGDSAEARPDAGIAVTRGGGAPAAHGGGEVSSAPAEAIPAGGAEPEPEPEPAAADLRELAIAVVDPTGAPVAGASLSVVGGDSGEGLEDAASEAGGKSDARVAQTDAEGRAAVLIPPEWLAARVTVGAPKHAAISLDWTSPEGAGAAPADAAAEAVAGEGAGAAEPWTITLPFETAIAGRVLDIASGEPAMGPLVAIQRDVGPQGWSDPVLRPFHEEGGAFYFGPIDPGRYWVWAYKPGTVRTETLTVEVAEGQRAAGLELALAPGATVKVSAYEKRTGLPVAGAVAYPHLDHLPGSVDLVHRGDPIDPRVRNAARTGDDGVAVLEDLPVRKTLLRVLHRGFRPVDVWVEPSLAAPLEIQVALEPGTAIRGEVLDAAGQKVAGTQVLAITMSLDSKMSELSMSPVVDGAYEIANLNPGMYIVLHSTFEENDEHFKMKFATLSSVNDCIVDFVDVAELATLRGKITDATGAPLARGVVTVSTLDDLGEVIFESSTTDDQGHFEINNLALKEWAVGVSTSPEAMVTIGVVKLEQAIDYERDFAMPGGQIVGSVRDEAGALVSEVELLLFISREGGGLDWMGRSEVDGNGEFSFRGLGPGRYKLLVQGLTVRQEFAEDIELAEGGTERRDVTARPGGTVRVIVRDAAGQPVPDIGVRIIDSDEQPRNDGLPARTDAEGVYEFPSLGPGRYKIELRRGAEQLPAGEAFTAVVGETVEVVLTLP